MSKAIITVGIAAGAVMAVDLATKGMARGRDVSLAEHPGDPRLGFLVAGAPLAAAAGALVVGSRLGASMPMVAAGVTLFVAGGVLNGVELLVRGSNTNPIQIRHTAFNVADLSVVAGVGLICLGALPVVTRALAR